MSTEEEDDASFVIHCTWPDNLTPASTSELVAAALSDTSDGRMQPTMVRLSPAMHAAVKALSDEEDRTMAQTIRRAIRQYLERSA